MPQNTSNQNLIMKNKKKEERDKGVYGGGDVVSGDVNIICCEK